MSENKKGYWIYSCVAIMIGMGLFAFLGYLVYDLILKLSEKDFSNNTVIQALITLIITVFIGGYFSKWLEHRNTRKAQLFEIKKDVSITIIDHASNLYHHSDNIVSLEVLFAASSKVKLYFNDETLKSLNTYIKRVTDGSDKENLTDAYNLLIDELKKNITK